MVYEFYGVPLKFKSDASKIIMMFFNLNKYTESAFMSERLLKHGHTVTTWYMIYFIYDKGPESATDMPMTVN